MDIKQLTFDSHEGEMNVKRVAFDNFTVDEQTSYVIPESDIKCEEVFIKEEGFSEDIYGSSDDIDPLMCYPDGGPLIVDEMKRPAVSSGIDRTSEDNNLPLFSSSPYNTRKNNKLKSSYNYSSIKLTNNNNTVLRRSRRRQNLRSKIKKLKNVKKQSTIKIDKKSALRNSSKSLQSNTRVINNVMKKDEFSIFGDYIACYLRNLNDKSLQASTQWKICNILYNVNLSSLNKQ